MSTVRIPLKYGDRDCYLTPMFYCWQIKTLDLEFLFKQSDSCKNCIYVFGVIIIQTPLFNHQLIFPRDMLSKKKLLYFGALTRQIPELMKKIMTNLNLIFYKIETYWEKKFKIAVLKMFRMWTCPWLLLGALRLTDQKKTVLWKLHFGDSGKFSLLFFD